MSEDQKFLALGIYINSALFIIGVFVAGLVLNVPLAWKGAILTAGISYLAYVAQVTMASYFTVSVLLVVASVVSGILSAATLILR